MAPLSLWIGFHAALAALLALEWRFIGPLRGPRRRALWATALWLAAALALAAALFASGFAATFPHDPAPAVQFLAGYALEQSLSVDNLFVFLLLFQLFHIPDSRQQRVLFWGVTGAILMRGLFIALGLTLLSRFHWVQYLLAALLLLAALRLLSPSAETSGQTPPWLRWLTRWKPISPSQDHFWVREPSSLPGRPPRRLATVLLLALIAVELTDVVFALDSIPAVLTITRNAFLAYTSNILAVMSLRSLYVLLTGPLQRLRFIHLGLAALLALAALKMLLSDWFTVGPAASLAAIALVLALTLAASLLAPRRAVS